MTDEELEYASAVDGELAAVAACLRRALADVEAVVRSDALPLTKIDQVGALLEELGDDLERCVDRFLP